jgi:hypothetical protein
MNLSAAHAQIRCLLCSIWAVRSNHIVDRIGLREAQCFKELSCFVGGADGLAHGTIAAGRIKRTGVDR